MHTPTETLRKRWRGQLLSARDYKCTSYGRRLAWVFRSSYVSDTWSIEILSCTCLIIESRLFNNSRKKARVSNNYIVREPTKYNTRNMLSLFYFLCVVVPLLQPLQSPTLQSRLYSIRDFKTNKQTLFAPPSLLFLLLLLNSIRPFHKLNKILLDRFSVVYFD